MNIKHISEYTYSKGKYKYIYKTCENQINKKTTLKMGENLSIRRVIVDMT